MKEDIKKLTDEVKKVKKIQSKVQVKQREDNSTAIGSPSTAIGGSPSTAIGGSPTSTPELNVASPTYNGLTINDLKQGICHLDKQFECIHAILTALFSLDYIVNHSVSGQRANKEATAKPKFDERLYGVFTAIIKEKFPGISKPEITAKVQAVQKKYLKKK